MIADKDASVFIQEPKLETLKSSISALEAKGLQHLIPGRFLKRNRVSAINIKAAGAETTLDTGCIEDIVIDGPRGVVTISHIEGLDDHTSKPVPLLEIPIDQITKFNYLRRTKRFSSSSSPSVAA